jgi:capsular exopolysaccharide synthesis family protein
MSENRAATAVLTTKAEAAFRGLWASVFYARPEPPRAVLVCSADRGEGATTVACGLALAGVGQAQRGRVALVDFNLRTPRVDRALGLTNGAGVSDVLVGQADLGRALQRVGPGELDVLTAGEQPARLLEALQTDGVRQLLADLQAQHDQVVIDTAPVNQYPDAQVLAELADGVVLVARYGHTPREALLQARRRLDPRDAGNVLGAVLNMRTYPIPKFVYRRV